MNLETKIIIYKFTPQVFTLTQMMCQGKIDDVFIQDRPSVSGEQMVYFEKSFFKFICCPVSLLP